MRQISEDADISGDAGISAVESLALCKQISAAPNAAKAMRDSACKLLLIRSTEDMQRNPGEGYVSILNVIAAPSRALLFTPAFRGAREDRPAP